MTAPYLHIVFGYSAAHTLRVALTHLDRVEHIAKFTDQLERGPIDGTLQQRLDFLWDVKCEPDHRLETDLATFRYDVGADPETHVAWFSRRSASEVAGFLELVSHRHTAPMIVDVAEFDFMHFAHVGTERFIELGLLDRVRQQTPAEFAADRARWDQLKRENAPLRVMTPSGIVSAPIDHFDDDIRACITDDWQKGARVLGGANFRINSGYFEQADDGWIWSRLRYLMEETDELDSRGDTSLMRECWVRKKR